MVTIGYRKMFSTEYVAITSGKIHISDSENLDEMVQELEFATNTFDAIQIEFNKVIHWYIANKDVAINNIDIDNRQTSLAKQK